MSGTTKLLRIRGRVQGVFYRNWSRDEARRLGLSGWVRNRRDGSVEMVLSGPEQEVETMIARCREGPPAALVEQVEVGPSDETPPGGFEKRPTL
jgi:acylphosphatase